MHRIILTALQKQIICLLAQNKLYSEIASELNITTAQIADNIRSVFSLIGFKKVNAELARRSFAETPMN
jgi:DNA-binding CsgD family transcriptional regulator